MGREASYQAIPENCDLLARARKDRETAELMVFFSTTALSPSGPMKLRHPDFIAGVQALNLAHPGLAERYFYAAGRNYDKIVYLLSPVRRAGNWEIDNSMIYQSVYGTERLQPEAQAGRGRPIGFVPAKSVRIIADYLATITRDMLHEHYDPEQMDKMWVYKIHPDPTGEYFEWIWQEFEGMRHVYQQAAAHDEAMITVID